MGDVVKLVEPEFGDGDGGDEDPGVLYEVVVSSRASELLELLAGSGLHGDGTEESVIREIIYGALREFAVTTRR